MLFHEELFTRSQCICCQHEINGLGIDCIDCGSFRLCRECFASGAEFGLHRSDHRYRFFDSGSLVLSLKPTGSIDDVPEEMDTQPPPTWSAREEIRLLDAIEQYGFGNWQDISKHIETKNSTEAKTEYVNRYVIGPLGELTLSSTSLNEANRNIYQIQIQKPIDHTIPCDEGPLSPSLLHRLQPLEIATEEMLQLGYMPSRDDYEKEFDNDAERLVSQLSFTTEDDEMDVAVKLGLVDMYTRKLRERARRKRMIRDYQLVSDFFRKEKKPDLISHIVKLQLMTYERELKGYMRPFSQFLTKRENENLTKNLVKERELLLRLSELYKYRANGICRQEECLEYEREKCSIAPLRKRALETISEAENQEGRSGTKKALLAEKLAAPLLVRQLQMAIPPNSPKLKATSNVSEESAGVSPSAGRSLTPQQFSREDSSSKGCTESNESERVSYHQGQEDQKEVCPPQASEISSQQKEKLKDLDGPYIADPTTPSADLLTDKELQFCSKIRFPPAQYLTVKTALLLARKPKKDNQQTREAFDAQCPPNIIRPHEWEQMVIFFRRNHT